VRCATIWDLGLREVFCGVGYTYLLDIVATQREKTRNEIDEISINVTNIHALQSPTALCFKDNLSQNVENKVSHCKCEASEVCKRNISPFMFLR